MTAPTQPAPRPGQLPPQRSDHYLDLPDAHAVGTQAAQTAERTVKEAIRHRAPVCLHGHPGLGKTFAVHNVLRNLAPDHTIRLVFPPQANFGDVLAHTWHALGLGASDDVPASRAGRIESINQALASQFHILLIDEVQRLNPQSLEYFRSLSDAAEQARPAVVYVGSGNARQRILAADALHSRIYEWQPFKPLTADEALTHIPGYHPVWKDVDPQVILWGDDHIAHGNFRSWARLTSHVRDALEDDPKQTVTTDLLRWILSRIDPTTRFGD